MEAEDFVPLTPKPPLCPAVQQREAGRGPAGGRQGAGAGGAAPAAPAVPPALPRGNVHTPQAYCPRRICTGEAGGWIIGLNVWHAAACINAVEVEYLPLSDISYEHRVRAAP